MLSMSARDTTPISPLMRNAVNSIIQVKTETKNSNSVTARLARLAGDDFKESHAAIGKPMQ